METQNNTHHHQPPSSAVGFNHHHEEEEEEPQQFAKEYMFQKPLTPSDVGKLNRLVIPKQHAEKYFPMADQQKGLVLSFEDESGKLWWFRYSYWNSSQSYVLTKGWSRYVKEKRLGAGDVVLFQRHVLDYDRMFIGWRRRFAAMPGRDRMAAAAVADQPVGGAGAGAGAGHLDGMAAAVAQPQPIIGGDDGAQANYPSRHLPLPLPYRPDCVDGVEIYENVDTNYQRGVVATRRLRLFGVNLECQDNSEPSDPPI
ncbi:hypothetical protein L1987_04787 [Smallanthus sonchifolius]|uniref:Uncharacterized protein n=1 Tax=Smallanthus sonchifolius TaxID=185202 RepID=A0ACB9JTQ6_9ASTR|nr:hypothetical protein L1987_04787 [Smallanthus sonchifolius]